MGEDHCWVGGYDDEKVRKWNAALKLAYTQLSKWCLRFPTTEDNGTICKDCLLAFVDKE